MSGSGSIILMIVVDGTTSSNTILYIYDLMIISKLVDRRLVIYMA